MSPKPKNGLSAAFGKPKGASEPDTERDSEPASESEDAARDVLSAVKSGDAKSLNLALQRHYETCTGAETDDDGDMDEERY